MDTTATQLTTVTDTTRICTVVDPLTEAPVAVAAEVVAVVVIPIDRLVMVLAVSTAAATTSNFQLKTTTSRT